METKNILGSIVSLTVVVICVAAIMMPVVSDATKTTETFTNEGAFYVEVDPATDYTIEYDYSTDPGVLVINGDEVNIPFSNGYTVLSIDDAILRVVWDNTLQYKGDNSYIVSIEMLDLTVSNGSITGTYQKAGGSETSWPTTTYTKAYIISPDEQDLVMTAYNSTPKMNGDSEVYAFGQTIVNNNWYLFKITGTIDDGVTVSCLDPTSGEAVEGATISNLSINKTAVDGYLDLYNLTSITFTVTLADESTADCTYTAYIVPAEVTAELAQHLSSGEIALLNAIPVLVIVSLVIGAVGIAITSRRD